MTEYRISNRHKLQLNILLSNPWGLQYLAVPYFLSSRKDSLIMDITYSRCLCGAITIYLPTGESYSCRKSNKAHLMPDIDLRKASRLPDSYLCDHCVNHYGLDLCGCGCGATVGRCRNNLPASNIPMQILYGRTCVRAADAIGY